MTTSPAPASRPRPARSPVAAPPLLRVLVAMLLGGGLLVLVAPGNALAASRPGYVRLAHLSPDTPQVDVWLTSFRGHSFSKVLPGVGYGALSTYQRLAPGVYSVAMRPPGGSGSSDPLIRTTVRVQSGKAYTVAGVGRNSDLALRVLTDDLSRPPSGQARVRVVQASSLVPLVDVATTTGLSIASGARFPSTTAYADVPAQQWTLRATPRDSSAQAAEQTVQVQAGGIYTALVLDNGSSGLQLQVKVDAAGSSTTPLGSVDTGLGGAAGLTRPDAPSSLGRLPVGVLLVGLVGLVAGAVLLVARRPSTRAR